MIAEPEMTIEALLDKCSVTMYMQPIPSIRRQSLVGVEALCRGVALDGTIVMPDVLFGAARKQGLLAELDALCLDLAFEQFLPLLAQQPDLVLFLNVSSATLALESEGAGIVKRLAHNYGVDPRNVAIEIPEVELTNTSMLQRSIQRFNEVGFLVVLDDIGVKQSNLDRIVAVQPDILKIDRSLLQNINQSTHKQEVFQALVRMSERLGGWVIAEGIEHEDEAIVALELGGDILQGYYFGKPAVFDAATRQHTIDRMAHVAKHYKTHTIDLFYRRQNDHVARVECAQQATGLIVTANMRTFDDVLQQIIDRYPLVQSACILDRTGVQISDTCVRPQHSVPQKTIIFHPPTRGFDHSHKEYVYLLEHVGTRVYESVPYVPLPTQKLCVTLSCRVPDADQLSRILCLHMDAD